jgi:hypothetical protein
LMKSGANIGLRVKELSGRLDSVAGSVVLAAHMAACLSDPLKG